MSDLMLEARDLSLRFRVHHESPKTLHERFNLLLSGKMPSGQRTSSVWAVNGVNMSVHRGETVGLIGANGSGKSTLLRLLAGIYRPTRGSVKVYGVLSSVLELGLGFQPDLTGLANVRLGASLYGLNKAEVNAILPKVVEFAELGEFIDAPVKTYSSGMYSRLGFSVAIHLDPDILLVDEALAVGDERFRRKCLDRLTQIQSKGAAIIFVSHDVAMVKALCNRAMMLENGRIVAEGAPEAVTQAYSASQRGPAQ